MSDNFAPLDCIVQSAGRCNRNALKDIVGDITIFTLRDELNDRDYCSYVYDPILISTTKEVLSKFSLKNPIGEKRMLEQVGNYFDLVLDKKETEKVVDHMTSMSFDKVGEFELIEDYESIQAFIETDRDIKQARIQIENIKLSNMLRLIPKLKSVLNNNIISVRKPVEMKVAENLPCIAGTEIRYIPLEELGNWYDAEIGLNLHIDTSIERRII